MYLENRILKISDKFFKKKISRHPRCYNEGCNQRKITVTRCEITSSNEPETSDATLCIADE